MSNEKRKKKYPERSIGQKKSTSEICRKTYSNMKLFADKRIAKEDLKHLIADFWSEMNFDRKFCSCCSVPYRKVTIQKN